MSVILGYNRCRSAAKLGRDLGTAGLCASGNGILALIEGVGDLVAGDWWHASLSD